MFAQQKHLRLVLLQLVKILFFLFLVADQRLRLRRHDDVDCGLQATATCLQLQFFSPKWNNEKCLCLLPTRQFLQMAVGLLASIFLTVQAHVDREKNLRAAPKSNGWNLGSRVKSASWSTANNLESVFDKILPLRHPTTKSSDSHQQRHHHSSPPSCQLRIVRSNQAGNNALALLNGIPSMN